MAQKPQPLRTLPDIGTGIPTWEHIFLAQVKSRLEDLYNDPNPPGQVQNLHLTQIYPGILVAWNKTIGASRYVVYRNTVGTFSTATVVATLSRIDNVTFFNVTTAFEQNIVLYYWVRAENASGVAGPLSAMVPIPNSGPGTISIYDMAFAFMMADPDEWNDALVLAGSDVTGASSPLFMYTESDDSFWLGSDMTTESIQFPEL